MVSVLAMADRILVLLIREGRKRGGTLTTSKRAKKPARKRRATTTPLRCGKRLHVALIYNAHRGLTAESPEDRGSTADLRILIRAIARAIRRLGHTVTVVPLELDLFKFQRRLKRLAPDVVFNQYDDVVQGAFYEMRVAALVRMMGYPVTGSPSLALGLSRNKYMSAILLQGAGVPIPDYTEVVERIGDVDGRRWHFPLIVQPSREHAGLGTDRDSVVTSKKALRAKVRDIVRTYHQPALVQQFLTGREFNVGLVGGSRMRVLPLAEVVYDDLPPGIPPIMSYAAKFLEDTIEYQQTRVACPAAVDPALAKLVGDTALQAFRAVGGWGYGRVDIRLDAEGQPRVLEVNCNPCIEDEVALARSARAAGMPYEALLEQIIRAAIETRTAEVAVPDFCR